MMRTKQEKGPYFAKSNSSSVPESSSPSRLRSQEDESNGQPAGASGSDRGTDEALSRLEELRNDGDEPHLSEEEIKSNAQLQEDELMALEAIFGENIATLDRKGDLLSLQIYVPYDFPDGISVSTKLQSSSETLKLKGEDRDGIEESDETNEFLYTFQVQYLPPIVMTCLLPQSYPSHQPPRFIISAQWLDTHKISILCHMLDSIWSAQPGNEVIYQWIEWLHSSALSYFGFENGIVLGPYDMSESDDRRAISGYVTPEVDIPSLIGYNVNRCHEDFLNAQHKCLICFDDHAGSYFIRLPCQHFFCQKCMEAYCSMHVKEGTVTMLLCPDLKCGEVVPPAILKQVLGDDDYNRWESLLLQKTLDMMSDVIYCPRCETACLEDEDQHAQCQKCYFSFCTKCRERRHVGSECLSLEEKLASLELELSKEDYTDSSQAKDDRVVNDRIRRAKELRNEIRSMKEVMRSSKQCPTCQMAISRSEGCNKMMCQNCGNYFCYSCGKAINGYRHFGKGCELFPQEEIDAWNVQMNQRVARVNRTLVINQIQALQDPDHTYPCPICREKNGMIRNNKQIICRSCWNCFCTKCGKTVKRLEDHVGPKGCKQHSANVGPDYWTGFAHIVGIQARRFL